MGMAFIRHVLSSGDKQSLQALCLTYSYGQGLLPLLNHPDATGSRIVSLFQRTLRAQEKLILSVRGTSEGLTLGEEGAALRLPCSEWPCRAQAWGLRIPNMPVALLTLPAWPHRFVLHSRAALWKWHLPASLSRFQRHRQGSEGV